MSTNLEQMSVNAIRVLAADADSKDDGGESFPTLVTEGTAQPFEGGC